MHFVYELFDSRTGTVGYVGQTQDPSRRFDFHLATPGNSFLRAWKGRVGDGLSMRVVAKYPEKERADFMERWLIGRLRAKQPLCNMHDGGDLEPGDFSGVSDPAKIAKLARRHIEKGAPLRAIFPRGLYGNRPPRPRFHAFGRLGLVVEAMPCVDRGRTLSAEERKEAAAKMGLKSR